MTLKCGSLKVIESGSIWKLGYGFLFAFHSNYGRICSHFGDIQRQRMAWPWNLGFLVRPRHWEWRRSVDHIRLSIGRTLYITIALSCTIFELVGDKQHHDLEIWARGHTRSLKLVPCESFSTISCSQFIVTLAVSIAVYEISSVKEWRDVEKWVRGRSRSLKIVPFDRPYTTFYWLAAVTIARKKL